MKYLYRALHLVMGHPYQDSRFDGALLYCRKCDLNFNHSDFYP